MEPEYNIIKCVFCSKVSARSESITNLSPVLFWRVLCYTCGASGPHGRTEEQAVEIWIKLSSNKEKLKDLLPGLKESKKRWCAEEVDDAEEMWMEYPELLEKLVPIVEDL